MLSRLIKGSLIIIFTTILSTLAINAGDNIHDLSDSLLASVFSGSSKEKCPEEMVFVNTEGGGFCVDKYEVSPGKKCLFTDPKNQEETRLNLIEEECEPVSKEGVIPWRHISQNQAVSACAKVGKRLPSNEEWFLAALGTPDPADGWNGDDCNVKKNWKKSEPGITGSAEECVSFSGAYDMVGNMWEWVRDTVKNKKYNDVLLPNAGYVTSADEAGVPSETDPTVSDPNYNHDRFWVGEDSVAGMFRGGYWSSGDEAGIYSIHAHIPPSFVGVGVGFRCVK